MKSIKYIACPDGNLGLGAQVDDVIRSLAMQSRVDVGDSEEI